jgi:alpha-tubulin suppressor-like RCC1 family protein
LKSDGSIVGWGYDRGGRATPPSDSDFTAISAGASHSLALKSDDSIVGWGGNDYGQATPPDGNDFAEIAAGDSHSLALKSDGSIVGWGWTWAGQASPPEGNNFIAIAAGHDHSLAIRKEPCLYRLPGDLNDDCRVDYLDYAIMAENWLIDCNLNPENPACIPK